MTDPPTTAPSDLFRERLLDAMLEIAPESGWTHGRHGQGGRKGRPHRGPGPPGHPHGVTDLLEAFGQPGRQGGRATRLGEADIAALKVREKVRAGVKAWLGVLGPHKAAVKRAATTPANLLTGPKGLWAAADAIWTALGDKSTGLQLVHQAHHPLRRHRLDAGRVDGHGR